MPGGNSEWEPPDPIPNSEVTTLSADDSVGGSLCESRSLPGFYTKTLAGKLARVFLCTKPGYDLLSLASRMSGKSHKIDLRVPTLAGRVTARLSFKASATLWRGLFHL